MKWTRFLTVGAAAALLAGGCASHPNTGPGKGTDPNAVPASSVDRPKWEARSDGAPADGRPTPQQVADRAANYAKVLELAGASAPTTTAAGKSSPSSVQFDAPSPAGAPTSDAGPPAATQAVTASAKSPPDPRAQLLATSVKSNPMVDLPLAVPDGEELTTGIRAVDPLGTRLAKRARANPQDPCAQLEYQIYLMLSGGSDSAEPALRSAVGLPSDERDVLSAVIDGLSNFRSAVTADPNLTPTQQIRPLQDMLDRLRSGTDLSLSSLTLCRKISGFGLFDPMSPARFPMGRSSQVLVYCEVDNFLPRHMPDNQWETRLAQRLTLYGAAGTVIWEDKARGVTDVCHSRRRDFYTKEPVTLPPTLPAGEYKLRVTVTDRNANKYAETDVPLWVGGN